MRRERELVLDKEGIGCRRGTAVEMEIEGPGAVEKRGLMGARGGARDSRISASFFCVLEMGKG